MRELKRSIRLWAQSVLLNWAIDVMPKGDPETEIFARHMTAYIKESLRGKGIK